MAYVLDPVELVAFATTFTDLSVQVSERLHTLQGPMHKDGHGDDDMPPVDESLFDLSILCSVALHYVQLCSLYSVHNEDIGY